MWAFSLVAMSGSCSSLQGTGFSLCGFFCYRAQAPGVRASAAVAHGLWSTGSMVVMHRLSCFSSRHVGSSWTRDRTSVPCISRQILNHWPTREAQDCDLYYILYCVHTHVHTHTVKNRNMLSTEGRPPFVKSDYKNA